MTYLELLLPNNALNSEQGSKFLQQDPWFSWDGGKEIDRASTLNGFWRRDLPFDFKAELDAEKNDVENFSRRVTHITRKISFRD